MGNGFAITATEREGNATTNVPLRLRGQGTGGVEIDRIIGLNLPTAAPATSGAFWRDTASGNVIKQVP